MLQLLQLEHVLVRVCISWRTYVLESKIERVNLTGWAHAHGIHVQTTYRWYREGTLPVPVQKVGRLILVPPETATEAARKAGGAGLYARASSQDQKSDLDGQVGRLSAWAAEAGLPVVRAEAEAGSGMNGSRAKAVKLQACGGAV